MRRTSAKRKKKFCSILEIIDKLVISSEMSIDKRVEKSYDKKV